MSDRIGDWIQTFTARQFWPLDPRAEEICIEDIAHALANQCRFSGHCERFYSVAQHSVLVSGLCQPFGLWGLLHDASEAYLVDLPRPLKRASELGWQYRSIEENLMRVICERFGLSSEEPGCVKFYDNVLLVTEMRDLMKPPPFPWIECNAPLTETVVPLSPVESERLFLDRYNLLTVYESIPDSAGDVQKG